MTNTTKILIIILIISLCSLATADLTWINVKDNAFPARYGAGVTTLTDGGGNHYLIVAGGTNGTAYFNDVWYSTDDGATWTQATASAAWSKRAGHALITQGDRLEVIGGTNGTINGVEDTAFYDVWYSYDLATWSKLTDTPAWKSTTNTGNATGLAYFGCAYDGSTIIINGGEKYTNAATGKRVLSKEVWTSPTGGTWTDAGDLPVYQRNGYDSNGWSHISTDLIPSGGFALAGGLFTTPGLITPEYPYYGTVYTTYDGSSWTTKATTAAFSPRKDFSLVYFDETHLVLYGGESDNNEYLRDVWYSTDDGATWSQYSDGTWQARAYPGGILHNGTLFVVGGLGSTGALSDVWKANITGGVLPTPTPTPNSGAGIQYPPHNVNIKIVNSFGAAVSGATITATPIETTYGSWSWVSDLFGITNEVNIAGDTLTGTTGTDGSVSFVMMEAIQYQITVIKASDDINYTLTMYPGNSEYIIPISTFSVFTNDEVIEDNFVLTVTTDDDTGVITVTGNATEDPITWGILKLNQTDPTTPGKETQIEAHVVSGNFTYDFYPTGYPGQSYFVRINLTSSEYPSGYEKGYGVTFPKETVNPMGLSPFILMFLSMGIILATGTVFTASTAHNGPLLTCFMGWILLGMGWLSYIGTVLAGTLLTIATVLSIIIAIAARKEAR